MYFFKTNWVSHSSKLPNCGVCFVDVPGPGIGESIMCRHSTRQHVCLLYYDQICKQTGNDRMQKIIWLCPETYIQCCIGKTKTKVHNVVHVQGGCRAACGDIEHNNSTIWFKTGLGMELKINSGRLSNSRFDVFFFFFHIYLSPLCWGIISGVGLDRVRGFYFFLVLYCLFQ